MAPRGHNNISAPTEGRNAPDAPTESGDDIFLRGFLGLQMCITLQKWLQAILQPNPDAAFAALTALKGFGDGEGEFLVEHILTSLAMLDAATRILPWTSRMEERRCVGFSRRRCIHPDGPEL